jgi:DnaJ-class molecular chaperone
MTGENSEGGACPKCLGRGRITEPTTNYVHNYDCPRCEGSGEAE